MNKKIKVPINSKLLYAVIESKTSIRKLGPMIRCNEKTIRRGLKEREISFELVEKLSRVLEVDATLFADLETFWKKLLAN